MDERAHGARSQAGGCRPMQAVVFAAVAALLTCGVASAAAPLGTTWEQLPRDPTSFPSSGGRIDGLVRIGDLLVAVGDEGSQPDPEKPGVIHGQTWTSTDGLVWTRSPVEPTMAGVDPWKAAGGPAGIVLIGGWFTTGNGQGPGDPHSRIWTSTDGSTWSPVGSLPDTAMTLDDVVSTQEGYLVAGRNVDGPNNGGSSIWSSGDGRTWTIRGTIPPPAQVLALAATSFGFVAVGEMGTGGPGVWTSPDGATWTRATGPAFTANGRVWDVAEWDHGLIAVGDGVGGPDSPAAMAWLSADGEQWDRVPLDAGHRTLMALSVTGGRAIALSFADDVDNRPIWTTTDGHAWSPASVRSAGSGVLSIYAALAFGDVLVAGGAGPGSGASIWISPPQGLLPPPTPTPMPTQEPTEPIPTGPPTNTAPGPEPAQDGSPAALLFLGAVVGVALALRADGRRRRGTRP